MRCADHQPSNWETYADVRLSIGPLTVPPQIARRRRAHQEKHPDAKIISLGIGDTTEPIPKSIAQAMQQAAAGMATLEGYSGSVTVWQPGLQEKLLLQIVTLQFTFPERAPTLCM